ANINRNAKTIRYELAKILRYQLRKMPELTFFIDDSLDYIDHIDDILRKDADKYRSTPRDDEQQESEQDSE
ncbi:MAG TPA: ribosome-binding factor A, partial [Candidatus Limisoma intestinavium]|nr:ribosome-binding factor A [Candidatus Limisoma intestinavium]